MDKQTKDRARTFLWKNHITKVNAESLNHALESQGFSVIRFNNIQNTSDVDSLIRSLHIQTVAAHSRGFTYMDSNFRLVFAHEGLTDDELQQVLAHELGHICCGHLSHAPIIGQDVKEEVEANDFASYILRSHPDIVLRLWIGDHKVLSVVILILMIVLLLYTGRFLQGQIDGSIWSGYYVTATGEKYHQKDCIFVKGKNTVRQLTKEEVESGLYAPCQICLPQR